MITTLGAVNFTTTLNPENFLRGVPPSDPSALVILFCLISVDVGRTNFGPNFEEKSAMRGARETGVVPLGRPPGGLPM